MQITDANLIELAKQTRDILTDPQYCTPPYALDRFLAIEAALLADNKTAIDNMEPLPGGSGYIGVRRVNKVLSWIKHLLHRQSDEHLAAQLRAEYLRDGYEPDGSFKMLIKHRGGTTTVVYPRWPGPDFVLSTTEKTA